VILRLAPRASHDIGSILDWSAARFGPAAHDRYERLIERGLLSIAAGSHPFGARHVPKLGEGVHQLHLRSCRLDPDGRPVVRPRHFILYRRSGPDLVIVLRVLHDAMNVRRQSIDG